MKKIILILFSLIMVSKVVIAKELSAQEANTLEKTTLYLKNGKYKQACSELENINLKDYNGQKEFLLGQCNYYLRNFEASIFHYEIMLKHDTNLPRVKLDLAKTLMSMGRVKKAKEYFNEVLALKLPASVRKNIQRYIDAINNRKKWNGVFSFGYTHTSNLNNAPTNPNITIFGLPFTLDKNALKRAGDAFESSFSIGKNFDSILADEWRFDTFGNILKYNNEKLYDADSLGASITPNYFYNNVQISIPVSYIFKWTNSKYSSGLFSIRPSFVYSLSNKTQIVSSILFSNEDGQISNDTINGNIYGLEVNVRHRINNFNAFDVTSSYNKNYVNELKYEDYKSYSLSMNFTHNFENHVSLSVAPSFTINTYNKIDPYDVDTIRKDKISSINVNLYKTIKIFNIPFTPIIGYSYTNNNSNIDRKDYIEQSVSFKLRKQF